MDIKREDLLNVRDRFLPPKKLAPKVDMLVSKIVGKQVLQRDPRLINLVMKHKKPIDSEIPDNLMMNTKFLKELKEVFNESL